MIDYFQLTPVVPDLLKKDLKILFIGYNPSLRSAEVGHHFAGRSNRFWDLLYKAQLTPEKLKYNAGYKLLEQGYGITNIVHRPTKEATEISNEEYKVGGEVLKQLLREWRPKIACYVGIGVYKAFSGNRKATWGRQENEMVKGTIDFAAPSSSGLNRMPLEQQINIYQNLKDLVYSLEN